MNRAVLLVAALLLLAGCSVSGRGGWDPFATGDNDRRVTVFVENLNRMDVSIEAQGAGRRHQLGTVGARSRQSFSVPWPNLGDIRFRIEVMAGPRHTTRGVAVGPGDRVELIVQDPVGRSFVRR